MHYGAACLQAVDALVRVQAELVDYSVNSVTEGIQVGVVLEGWRCCWEGVGLVPQCVCVCVGLGVARCHLCTDLSPPPH